MYKPVIDMSSLKKEGEFGSKPWCEACAASAVTILEQADLPEGLDWAFTEHYTHPPERFLADGRDKAAYYVMVKDGKISGGDGAPDEALAIPGLHVTARWAAICHQSGAFYGKAGGEQRRIDEDVMHAAIEKYLGRENPLGRGGWPPIVWPDEIGGPLMAGAEDGNGLHNIAAAMQTDSPEFADWPVTDMRVPDFDAMSEQQKQDFLQLLQVES